MEHVNWNGFNTGVWQDEINVRDFIQCNYTEYNGDDAFLEGATPRTESLMKKVEELFALERRYGGVLDIDTATVSSLTSYSAGYIDKDNEIIVGLQTNRPLKRGVNPFGGIRMARQACEAYGYKLSHKIEEEFRYKTTHNDGVFRSYTDEMRLARKSHVITGLPDAYGRGRIIGDYRRVALYGIDRILAEKKKDKALLEGGDFATEQIRLIEELSRQIEFLGYMKEMAAIQPGMSFYADLPQTRARLYSGPILDTLPLLRNKTARQCHMAESAHFLIFILSAILSEVY